jgi:hypothetical protein
MARCWPYAEDHPTVYKDRRIEHVITGFGARMIGKLQATVNIVLTTFHLGDSRVLLKKMIIAELEKKFPAVYGTRIFINVSTKARRVFYLDPDEIIPHPTSLFL